MSAAGRTVSGLVGALGEAWAELRTHKLRVLLSLIGIAVAVAALTAVLALGEYQRQSVIEQSDRYGGRVAMLSSSVTSSDGSAIDWDAQDQRVRTATARFEFTRTSRIANGSATLPVQYPDIVREVPATLIDPDYPVMHRMQLLEGRWPGPAASESLAPPVVVSEPLWDALGRTPLDAHPTLRMTGDLSGLYTIVGVSQKEWPGDTEPKITMLIDSYEQRAGALPADAQVAWEFWVPEQRVDEIAPVLAMDLRAGLPAQLELSLSRSDWAAQGGMMQQFDMMNLITGAIAGLVLMLGGLSLLNVQLVAMRQRIREIGVRRSFGATGGRIFTTVMLESVVATTVAGFVGIILTVIVMRSPLVMDALFSQMQDAPPFPLAAALAGLGGSVAVGALAGLIPALIALRVKVIDAIRF